MTRRLSKDVVSRLLDLSKPLAQPREATPVFDFGNKFEILREVGRGGMGVVYEAAYRGFPHMRAAIKVLSSDVTDFETRQRFADEAQSASTLVHPNIPRIYEIHSSYLAMQFIDGNTLGELLDEVPDRALGRTPNTADGAERRRLVRLLRDACLATHYAHQQGLVHRDIKPQNLMVTADDQVFVMDFGLAKRIDGRGSIDDSGRVLGTPVYMAPEQAEGRDDLVDARSDVHALGATLYQLLSGKPPFMGDSRDEVLRCVVEDEPVHLGRAAPGTDSSLADVVMRCLSKDRGQRPDTAYSLALSLSGCLSG